MELLHTRAELRAWRQKHALAGSTVGFVPTMGALHHGHLSLVTEARKTCPMVVASVFVNRLQFNQSADFDLYPRVPDADAQLLAEAGCSALFAPIEKEMYPVRPQIKMNFGSLEKVLEGQLRPGHFSGVGIVVSRLFNLVLPNKAYFGQKDLQQVAVIRRLAQDLDFDLEVIACPTEREPNGLAMSSRNLRLSEEGRTKAADLHQALQAGLPHLLSDPENAAQTGQNYLEANGWLPRKTPADNLTYEYIVPINANTFAPAEPGNKDNALVLAAWLEGVRLIDNVTIGNH